MRTVKTLLASRALRAPIVVLAAVAWLAVSNHCALASLAGSAKLPSTHSCHGMKSDHAPAKQKHGGEVECCKVLRATLTKSTNFIPSGASIFALQYWLPEATPVFRAPQATLPLELDTGPPFCESFAETVLQRSILVHAPPFFA